LFATKAIKQLCSIKFTFWLLTSIISFLKNNSNSNSNSSKTKTAIAAIKGIKQNTKINIEVVKHREAELQE
jgi:hypothetical protein